MMVHWPSYLYIYPSWTDILAYCTDRITDVTLRGAKERSSCVGQGVAELGSEGREVAGGFTGWWVAVATPPPAGMVGVCGITTKSTRSNSERTTTKPKPQNPIRNDQQPRNDNQVDKEQSNQSR
jgi:hypothetical protein